MGISDKLFSGYDTGADFWRDTAVSHGIDDAIVICNNYLKMNLKREHHDDERQFCRELFAAMCEAMALKTENTTPDRECAKGIDDVIRDSCYKTNFFNLEIAAMIAILNCGFARVNLVLAFNIQKRYNDRRYSSANKRWAQTITVPECNGVYLNSHACLVDGFADYVRKLQEGDRKL